MASAQIVRFVNGVLTTTEVDGSDLGTTALHPISPNTYTLTSAYRNIATGGSVVFTAPKTGKVLVEARLFIESPSTHSHSVYLRLQTAEGTGNSLGIAFEQLVWKAPSNDTGQVISTHWYVTGLSTGTMYSYVVAGKYTGSGDPPICRWGGENGYPPLLIEVRSMP